MKLTAIVPRHVPNSRSRGVRIVDRVDEFVEALARSGEIRASVLEAGVVEAPADGYLLAFRADRDQLQNVRGRVVLADADRSTVPRILEEHDLVAAIEKHRYSQWLSRKEPTHGFFGRKDVAHRIGATLTSGWPETERFGLLVSSLYADLPSFLAAYLVAYDEMHGSTAKR